MPSSATVYRVGPVSAPPSGDNTEVAALNSACDTAKPAGHPARTGCLFAAPDLKGATRWVRSAHMMRSDATCRALRVDPTGLHAYRIRAWDLATVSGLSTTERAARFTAYWASGVPLANWDTDSDGREWEVLVPPAQSLGSRPVGPATLLSALPDSDWTRTELANSFAVARRSR